MGSSMTGAGFLVEGRMADAEAGDVDALGGAVSRLSPRVAITVPG